MATTSANAGSVSDYRYLHRKWDDEDEEETIYDSLSEKIEKRGDEWCVITHQTGKNMGCYDDKEDAKERLQQIQMFDHIKELLGNKSPKRVVEHLTSGSFHLQEKDCGCA